MFETSACLFQQPSSRFLCLPSETKTLHAMLPVSIGNIAARVAFSPCLSKSCVSVLFCNNQFNRGSPLFSGDSLDFSVTTESPECTFTTAIGFCVCEDVTWDAVLGSDYIEQCSRLSGASSSSFGYFCYLAFFAVNASFTSTFHNISYNELHVLNDFISRVHVQESH
jgi:hypothetical protein